MNDTKPSNPKDAIGSKKLMMHLVPSTMNVYAAMAFTEGALKYGKYNWRVAGVRASIYLDALARHIAKWTNGEECDPDTGVPHLANALACLAIIVDAKVSGMLTDDRPPAQPELATFINDGGKITVDLQNTFKDHSPIQYTISYKP